MRRYSKSEIRFNLLAVVANRKGIYLQDIQNLEKTITALESRLPTGMFIRFDFWYWSAKTATEDEERDDINKKIQHAREEIGKCQNKIAVETEKFKSWRVCCMEGLISL